MKGAVYDCIIVGAGPAGLSAALILGRCRRSVLVCDSGKPRNAASHGLHGFLSRDCIEPAELIKIGRKQLERYETVELLDATVVAAERTPDGFQLTLQDGQRFGSKNLLLATGIVDELPDIDGLLELYGTSVHHCPYCDGWEHRDEPLAVLGNGKSGVGMSLTLSHWSRDLVLCTNGPVDISDVDRERLARRGVQVRADRIRRLVGHGARLEQIVFDQGEPLARSAVFVHTDQRQHSDLASRLGCRVNEKDSVETGRLETTNVPGLFAAGDTSCDVQLAIIAAAEGATAAFAINKALLEQEVNAPADGRDGSAQKAPAVSAHHPA